MLLAGGWWGGGSLVGSRCRNANRVRSDVNADIGSRGSSRVIRSAA